MSKVPVISTQCVGVLLNILHFACNEIQKQQKLFNYVEIISQPDDGVITAQHILDRGPLFQKEFNTLSELQSRMSTETVDRDFIKSVDDETFGLLKRFSERQIEELKFAIVSLDHNSSTKGVMSAAALSFKVASRIDEVRRMFSEFTAAFRA